MSTEPRTKKIIFVLPELCAGGAERALITLMNNLSRDLFSPEMIVLNGGGPLSDWIIEDIPLHNLGNLRVSQAFFSLKKKLKSLQPDIVMTTMAHSNFLLMAMRPFFPNTKFIIREAVVPAATLQENRGRQWFIRALYKFLYPKADAVLSPSQDIIDDFKTLIGLKTDNHTLLFNQVDSEKIQQKIESPKDPPDFPKGVRFVCAGRLHYQKGYDLLINALAELQPPFEWSITILGDGEERTALEKLIKIHDLENRVILRGQVKNPWRYMAAADCLLLPSRWEGMPNVVLESLACGTPVIANSAANGVREIASYAHNNALMVAEGMDAFIAKMSNIKPQNKTEPAPSLLPKVFEKSQVMKEFKTLLLDL